jgi:chromosome segregation ATPase
MASLSPVPILAAAESGALLKAFSLVFNPVGTVVEGRTMALQHRTQALQRQTTGLQETNMFLLLQHQTIRSQVASLEGKVKVLRQENAEAQARETSARANALVLKKHVAEVQAAVAARDARILEFDTKAAGMAQAVNGLTQELADAQRALAASTGARDIQQREIRQLNTTVERQAQALADCDRLLSGLASAAGLKSVDLLNEGLRSARAPESRISIIKAIGAVPRATERADIRNQLQTLERTGPADVQRAAKGVLNR